MTLTDIESVTEQLSAASVDDELSFAGKGLKLDGAKDAEEVVQQIKKFRKLRALRLEGNTLGIEAAQHIAKALEERPEFERALWSDMFTGRLKSEIPDALRYLGNGIIKAGAKLVELDLSDNAFGPNGMNGLTDFLRSSSCYSLQELRLHNNGLGVTGGKMLASCLLDCYKSSVKAGTPLALRVFVSGRGRLENEGSIALSEAFKMMGTLEEVQMPQNGINHAGITALADAFAANKNLRYLNLQDNTFTKVGAASMAKALKHMQNLEVINFGDCLLRNKGGLLISNALKEGHEKLKDVQLSFNEIKASGAIAISEALCTKEHLERLDLDGNILEEDTVEVIKSNFGEREEILGSFEDVEEPDDEEGSETEDEEDEEGEDSESTPTRPVTVTPEEFLAFPSPQKLQNLGSDSSSKVITHLGDKATDMDEALKAFVKLASVIKSETDPGMKVACECADAIFSKLLSSNENTVTFSNSLLVHLGILKSEDKKFRAPTSIDGQLLVLDHVVKQTYFPQATRDFLQCFLGKPHPLLETSAKNQSKLLQTLYKF